MNLDSNKIDLARLLSFVAGEPLDESNRVAEGEDVRDEGCAGPTLDRLDPAGEEGADSHSSLPFSKDSKPNYNGKARTLNFTSEFRRIASRSGCISPAFLLKTIQLIKLILKLLIKAKGIFQQIGSDVCES